MSASAAENDAKKSDNPPRPASGGKRRGRLLLVPLLLLPVLVGLVTLVMFVLAQRTPFDPVLAALGERALTMDGPFAETKEQLGGYYLVEAPDKVAAAAIAAKIPGARFGCVEVRPIMTFS